VVVKAADTHADGSSQRSMAENYSHDPISFLVGSPISLYPRALEGTSQ
jgi:hypothetical protein